MSDFENKVKELLEQGKITPEEAQELLAGHQEPELKQISLPSTGNERVLKMNLKAGDIKIRGDSTITGPQMVGYNTPGLTLTTENGAWIVRDDRRFDEDPEGGLLNKVMGFVGKLRPIKIDLLVPTTLERLDIHLLAGDLDIQGVPAYAHVNVQAGDIDIEGVTGFDVSAKAGDVDITADLKAGNHGVELLAGDLDLNLTQGSNAKVNVNLTAGDFDARGIPTTKHGGTVTGGRYEAVVGSGDASVTINVNAGDIDLRVR